jgi:DMSO/TMAO reductase YedYZ heme-binding membrane subunit
LCVSEPAWHLRHVRSLIYAALCVAIVGIAYTSQSNAPDVPQAWVEARELYGLWALGLLLAAMLCGPLSFVVPWLPFRGHLMLGRRALGVSAAVLAALHLASYLGPTMWRDWRDLYRPGPLWMAGLLLGLPLLLAMGTLAWTSRDRAVRELGPRRWRRWHRAVYLVLPGVLLHATFLGADFGVNKGPDVPGQPDTGSLVAMLAVGAAWLALFVLRKWGVRWTWSRTSPGSPRALRR